MGQCNLVAHRSPRCRTLGAFQWGTSGTPAWSRRQPAGGHRLGTMRCASLHALLPVGLCSGIYYIVTSHALTHTHTHTPQYCNGLSRRWFICDTAHRSIREILLIDIDCIVLLQIVVHFLRKKRFQQHIKYCCRRVRLSVVSHTFTLLDKYIIFIRD